MGYCTSSKYLSRHSLLHRALGRKVSFIDLISRLSLKEDPSVCLVVWGKKKSSFVDDKLSRKYKFRILRVEDGFLRSVFPGQDQRELSFVVDFYGIYYDAHVCSYLDQLTKRPLSLHESSRSKELTCLWQSQLVSKYNHAPRKLFTVYKPFVLVVDQTYGDASVKYGSATQSSFDDMLSDAFRSYPNHTVLVKTHPEVVSGKKQGYLTGHPLLSDERVILLSHDVHPPALLNDTAAVFCVTSQMGFEALIWGKPVYCFGMPFYAGRGLTIDRLPAPSFRCPCTIEQLIHSALVDYCRYVDPETGERCDPERAISWMGLQRKMMERFGATLKVARFPRWKRLHLKKFFLGSELVENCSDPNAPIVVWGMSNVPEGDRHRQVIRVEDGFIRSAGLGVDLVAPQSWVLDTRGIYYDSSKPSDLEQILQFSEIDQTTVERGKALIERLCKVGATKYNVGLRDWVRPPNRKRVILVPGQVESDASVRFGSPKIKTNADLLAAVRGDNPDAWIVYKVHPDVAAGMRKGKRRLEEDLYDEVVTDQDMHHMLMQVDEVHTMTSLAGFEGLIRGKRVVCYGQPFYCGWGLTEDKEPVARRTRPRSLPELVAAALILYPTYVSSSSGYFTSVERVLDEIQLARAEVTILQRVRTQISRYLRFMWRF